MPRASYAFNRINGNNFYNPVSFKISSKIRAFFIGGTTFYRISMGYSSSNASIYIDKIGAGKDYSKARVVRIYANTSIAVTSGGSLPESNIDYTDYEQVRKYYNLP
jgi:hypothetical protein